MFLKLATSVVALAISLVGVQAVQAKTVNVTMTTKETTVEIDNKGTKVQSLGI